MTRFASALLSQRPLSILTGLAILLTLATGPDVTAAERKVLGEQFTATWCGPCVNVREATSMLIDNYGDELVMFMAHVSDAYEIPLPAGFTRTYSLLSTPRKPLHPSGRPETWNLPSLAVSNHRL